MKFIKLCVLFLLLIYVLPFGIVAHNSHHPDDTTEDGHCVLMCHALCTHAVVPNSGISITASLSALKTSLPLINFSYQNPFLDSFKRPPISTT